MVVDNIFQELINHGIKGMMFHDEMSNYYNFLNLKGYRMCHEYHFLSETCNYRKLYNYYIKNYGKLIEKKDLRGNDIIAKSWYSHERKDIDATLKRQSVQSGIQTWVKWQTETKELYEKSIKQLMDENQIAAALFLKQFLFEVIEELNHAKEKHLNLKATNFDINFIIECQEEKYKKYKEKIELALE